MDLHRENDKFPFIKVISAANALQRIREGEIYSPEYGFLHIAKTGGTSVIETIKQNRESLSRIPTLLFHSWRLSTIRKYFPNMKLCFLIRDPLERIISGFQSRLSMGLPQYHVPWTAEEATSFSIYPNVESFIEGHLSPDPFHKSALEFTARANVAIRWGYSHHFGSKEEVSTSADMFYVVRETNDSANFMKDLQEKGIIQLRSANCNIVDLYRIRHKSEKSTRSLLQTLSSEELNTCRMPYEQEYSIYNALRELTISQMSSSSGDT